MFAQPEVEVQVFFILIVVDENCRYSCIGDEDFRSSYRMVHYIKNMRIWILEMLKSNIFTGKHLSTACFCNNQDNEHRSVGAHSGITEILLKLI